jgi:hypothetical protein
MSKSRRYAIVREQFFFLLNIISNITTDNAQWSSIRMLVLLMVPASRSSA